MRHIITAFLGLVLLVSTISAEPPTDFSKLLPEPPPSNCRISVKPIGSFIDPNTPFIDPKNPQRTWRVIYLIRDKETNREFFGIDGMGIGALGAVSGSPKP